MEIVIHRVNQRARLRDIPREFGAEIDLRADGSRLVLHHDPFQGGENFDRWLEEYEHGLLVLNIKEAGIETEVIRQVEARGITRFFLLDVEFPYIYRACRDGESRVAMRYSEDESIETVLRYRGKADWVWIDTNTHLPLTPETVKQLHGFKSCLVCPERWNRAQDIPLVRSELSALGYVPNAVMTSLDQVAAWSG